LREVPGPNSQHIVIGYGDHTATLLALCKIVGRAGRRATESMDDVEGAECAPERARAAAYANVRIAELIARHRIVGEGKAASLAIGMELVKDRGTKRPAPDETLMLAKECMKRGLLVLRLGYFGNHLNMMPSLDSSRAEMEFIFDTLEESLSETEREA